MKQFVFLILILFSAQSIAQKITFDIGTLVSQDSSIIAIRELWKSYVLNYKKENDSIVFKYWNKAETNRGLTDIIISTTPIKSYLNADLLTFEIKKIDTQFYIIRNILTLGGKFGETSYNEFTIIYNIYAKKDSLGFKLYNGLYQYEPKLLHFETKYVDFYYPVGYKFNNQKASELCTVYSDLINKFGNPNKHKVIYLIGNNLDEAYHYIGVEYTPFSSSNLAAGYHIESQNIILTCRENHLHELIHTIFKQYGGSTMFQEGIATYYGGMGGSSYSVLIHQLKKAIASKPKIDLSKFDDLDNSIGNGDFNNYYIIGAIFIDYAFKIGGSEKVMALFRYKDVDTFKFDGAVTAVCKEFGIQKDQINSFLKNYINTHKDS